MAGIKWTIEEKNKLKELISLGLPYEKIQLSFPQRSLASLYIYGTRILKQHNGYIKRKYSFDENFWAEPNLINSYWGGFMATDGNIAKSGVRILLAAKDVGHLEKFKKDCKTENPIRIFKKSGGFAKSAGDFCCVSVNTNGRWHKDLENNFSVIPNKTIVLEPPKLENINLKLAYLKGYIDGDGSICFANRKNARKELVVSICGASLPMIEWIKKEIDSITDGKGQSNKNRKIRIIKKEGYRDFYSYGKSGLKAAVLFDYLSKLPTPVLARKWLKPEVLDYIAQKKLEFPQYFN